ncbi:MAG: hypothetical protein ACI3Z7_05195 [Candidatus Aphodosoma sp.]
MIYKFLILSDEADNFSREIEINSDATFLELNNAILNSVNYQPDQLTSFFHCMNGWEKYEEITLIEMDTNPENDSFTMDSTHIDEFITDEGDRLIFVFDMLTERSFFIELKEMKPGTLDKAQCTRATGKAPKQLTSEDEFLLNPTTQSGKQDILDDDFYGDSEFDMDELDAEGFGDVGLDELGENY